MTRLLRLLPILCLSTTVQARWEWLGSELSTVERELASKSTALKALGEPMIGQTVPEFGLQHGMHLEAPPESPYVQVDLAISRDFDTVVLVPAVVDFQSLTQSAYAFPPRYRLDASDDENFATFSTLKVQLSEDAVLHEASPVIVRSPGIKARYLRLTVPTMARVEGRWTFALSEFMVLHGNRNIAIGAEVRHRNGTKLPPRWHSQNVTDGRTPLGPPMDRTHVPEYDALFVITEPDVPEPWMQVDLDSVQVIDEIRLHPLHARQGADVPGFRFPNRFRIDVAMTESMANAVSVFETGDTDFSNPGNNPVTFPLEQIPGRFVRVTMLKSPNGPDSFALSELEVYAEDNNAARGMRVTSSGDRIREVMRPLSLLTDGHVSYGRLMELPKWLDQWEQRQTLTREIQKLEADRIQLQATTTKRAVILVVVAIFAVALMLFIIALRSRRRQGLEQENLRNQLARDMHDEIGSNLAGIAVISELPSHDPEDWKEINRIAHETTDAMREVLWLVGARQESGIDLVEQLQRAARRLLPNHEVCWNATSADLPASWPMDSSRQVFLFFKEAVTNILRHAKATKVTLSAQVIDSFFELIIDDNGCGFDPATARTGMGLASLSERAKQLGGTFRINSSHQGTMLTLRVPILR